MQNRLPPRTRSARGLAIALGLALMSMAVAMVVLDWGEVLDAGHGCVGGALALWWGMSQPAQEPIARRGA